MTRPTTAGLLALLIVSIAPSLAAQTTTETATESAEPPRAAAAAVDGEKRVITGDYTLREGESVGELVVVGGTLHVRGEVTGDAVVVGGDLIMEASGVVGGDALVTDGEIVNEGGLVRGEMRTVEALSAEATRAVASAQREARSGERAAPQRASRGERSWFEPIRRGFAGLISTVALGLVLGGIGALLVFYGRPYLETVSDTVRAAAWRSAAVGVAANFLAVPLFVALIVILAVSLVGIPLLIVAVPLYPLAVAAAAAFGLLAAAHAIGERTAEQGDLGNLRYRNAYAYLFTGLGMLIAPLVAAHLLGMTGFLGFISALILVVTWTAIWLCATVGLGAVILSRGGRRRTFVPTPPAVDLDPDLFDEEISTREPHV